MTPPVESPRAWANAYKPQRLKLAAAAQRGARGTARCHGSRLDPTAQRSLHSAPRLSEPQPDTNLRHRRPRSPTCGGDPVGVAPTTSLSRPRVRLAGPQEERRALEKKYEALYQPLYDKRSAVVTGKEDVEHPADDTEGEQSLSAS